MAATLPSRPRVMNLEPKSLADILQNIREVAAAMGHVERAEQVCRRLENRIAEVVKRVECRPRPTVFVMEWAEPIFNAGHWTPELVRLAGGHPVLAAEGEYSVRIPWEDFRAANPEILVIACCGHGVERTRKDLPLLESLAGWGDLRAVRNGRVHLVDGSAYFSRPGPRVVDTLEILASLIHPEVCQGVYPDRGVERVRCQ
jgi:iron complex transport system substrate-binding protein